MQKYNSLRTQANKTAKKISFLLEFLIYINQPILIPIVFQTICSISSRSADHFPKADFLPCDRS